MIEDNKVTEKITSNIPLYTKNVSVYIIHKG